MGDECDLQTLLLCKGNAKVPLTTKKKKKAQVARRCFVRLSHGLSFKGPGQG